MDRRLLALAVCAAAAAPAAPAATPADARSPRNATYVIDARLDHRAKTITGKATLTWRNTSNRTARELPFHLYYNAWRDSRSTWMREAALASGGTVSAPTPSTWGWIDVTAIRVAVPVGSTPVDVIASRTFDAPDDGNVDDRTVMTVSLPTPVRPGDTATIDLAWTARIPRPFSRTGTLGSYYFIAQWFPKIGVLEDTGWNCHQFHAATEFFADYGVYDVRLTVPEGWIVGATGQEQARTANADGTTTHSYRAEDVHDFAWTTSPDFVEHTARFEHPTLPPVIMRLLMQPEHGGQESRYFRATRATLRYYGEWFGPYPYGYITIVDPAWQSRSGGMEYPTLFTGGTRWLAPDGISAPEGVTVHEAGHQFWYGIVGNNEFEHAWMDEGVNTYSTARAIEADPELRVSHPSRRYFGGFVPWVFRDIVRTRDVDGNGLAGYRATAESDVPATPSFRYFPATGGGLTYNKTALWLHTLERLVGWPTFQKVLATHFRRSAFRHPTPDSFFATVNEVVGRDMTWFFDQVHRSSNTFDYGVESVNSVRVPGPGVGHRTTVVIRRYGEAVFPVDIVVVFDNGERLTERWPGQERWKALTYDRPAAIASVTVDPDRVLLLDVNYANNSYVSRPAGPRAAARWAARWMVWLQDALLSYAWLV